MFLPGSLRVVSHHLGQGISGSYFGFPESDAAAIGQHFFSFCITLGLADPCLSKANSDSSFSFRGGFSGC